MLLRAQQLLAETERLLAEIEIEQWIAENE